MAKRLPNANVEPVGWQDEMEPDDEAIQQALSELGEGAKTVSLSVRDEKDKTKMMYLGQIPLSEFSLERIKEDFGGGYYRAKIKDARGAYIKHLTFCIDSRFKQPTPPQEKSSAQSHSENQPASALGELKEIILKQNETIIRLLEAKATDKASAMDPLTLALKMAEIMKPAAPAPAGGGGSGWSDAFSIFQQGMKIGMEMEGGGGYGEVINSIGKPLLGILEAQARNGAEVLRKAKTDIPGKIRPKPTLDQYFATYIPQLIRLAQAEKKPQAYADLMLDQVPDEWVDDLAIRIHDPNFVTWVCSSFDGAEPVRAWIEAFVARIKDGLTDADDNGEPGSIDVAPTKPDQVPTASNEA